MAEHHAFEQQSPPEDELHREAQAGAPAPMDVALDQAGLPSLPSDDALAAYLRDVRSQHRLSADEEKQHAAQLQAGLSRANGCMTQRSVRTSRWPSTRQSRSPKRRANGWS